MPRPYPSLTALRAFEVAARHLSFKKAGEELHVTPAAVSLQVRMLEGELGVALFYRGHRSIALTSAGRAILPEVRAGFDAFARVMPRLEKRRQGRILKVATAPAFASKWLAMNLDRFPATHPDLGVEIRVHAAQELANYTRDGIDIGVRYGLGDYEGLTSERLLRDALIPVCSPRLMDGGTRFESPKDLIGHSLLHDDSLSFDPDFPVWDDWLRAAGVAGAATTGGLRFNSASDAIMAAVQGLGPLLARQTLVGADVLAGRLVRLFDVDYPLVHGFHVVYREDAIVRPEVSAFRDWLFGEIPAGAAWL